MSLSFSVVVLLTTNTILTILSIYWAISAWASLKKAHEEPPWPETNCLVLSKTIESRSIHFRPEFTVTNFSIQNRKQEGTAFRYSNPEFNESKEDAQAYIDSKEINKSYTCWQSPAIRNRLSLSNVPVGVRAEHANIAAISTILTIAAIFSLAAIIYLVFFSPPSLIFTEVVTPPSSVSRTGLSSRTIDVVIDGAKAHYESCSRERTEEPTCTICLEEENGARMPCGHAFHPLCIRGWLARGAETCPLCCASVVPLDRQRSGSLSGSTDVDAYARVSSTRFPSINSRALLNLPIIMPQPNLATTLDTPDPDELIIPGRELTSGASTQGCEKPEEVHLSTARESRKQDVPASDDDSDTDQSSARVELFKSDSAPGEAMVSSSPSHTSSGANELSHA